jgi:hypothetical protein
MSERRVIYPHKKKKKTPKTASLDPAVSVQSVSDADDRPLAAVDGEFDPFTLDDLVEGEPVVEKPRRRRCMKISEEEVDDMAAKPNGPAKPAAPFPPAPVNPDNGDSG